MYFAAGMALLDESDWNSQYELTFNLRLERVECELLSGNFEAAEQGDTLGKIRPVTNKWKDQEASARRRTITRWAK